MIFTTIKIIGILIAVYAVLTLFRSKIKLLGKIAGTVVVALIAVSSKNGDLINESIYVIANLVVLFTTIIFKINVNDSEQKANKDPRN